MSRGQPPVAVPRPKCHSAFVSKPWLQARGPLQGRAVGAWEFLARSRQPGPSMVVVSCPAAPPRSSGLGRCLACYSSWGGIVPPVLDPSWPQRDWAWHLPSVLHVKNIGSAQAVWKGRAGEGSGRQCGSLGNQFRLPTDPPTSSPSLSWRGTLGSTPLSAPALQCS